MTKRINTNKPDLFDLCRSGQIEEVKKLLEECPFSPFKLNYCLKWTAYEGHKEICELLIENGADPRTENDSPLCFAATNGKIELVKFFLEFGADIHVSDDYPLRMAAKNCHPELVDFLIQNGADVRAYNDYALRFAAVYGHKEVVRILLDNGAKITADALWRVYDKGEHDETYREIGVMLFESLKHKL